MSWLLFCVYVKIMTFPSGDHRGALMKPLAKVVNCNGFEPSLLATQICKLPERSDVKASLRPSGENCG